MYINIKVKIKLKYIKIKIKLVLQLLPNIIVAVNEETFLMSIKNIYYFLTCLFKPYIFSDKEILVPYLENLKKNNLKMTLV